MTAGKSVIFRTASELISELRGESHHLRRRKFKAYGRVDLLCIDEIGYLSYDAGAADLLYEIINCRYEEGPSRNGTTFSRSQAYQEGSPNARVESAIRELKSFADSLILEREIVEVALKAA